MNIEYDQHFLTDKSVIDDLFQLVSTNNEDVILEIGSGKGALTSYLEKKPFSKLIINDIDSRNYSHLKTFENSNVEFILGDGINILKSRNDITFVISALPYSITEPFYTALLSSSINQCVIIHGKSFFEMFNNTNSKWHYFILSFFECGYYREIGGDSFSPSTKTTSVLLRLSKKQHLRQRDLFYQYLFFNRMRKTKHAIVFALVDSLSISKKQARELIAILNIDLEKKLSQLSNLEFLEIVNCLKNKFRD